MQEIEDARKKKNLREAQGKALQEAIDFLKNEHVDVFEWKKVGDYIVSIASEESEGMYEFNNGELQWQTPGKQENQHLEVIVQDADDKRFVPYLNIKVDVLDQSENMIAELNPQFLWHPVANHYGQNYQIPSEGNYSFEVSFDAPAFGRHDEILGKRLVEPVKVKFGPHKLQPEREPHGPE